VKKSTFWTNYLSRSSNNKNLELRLCLCEKAFADHKENVSQMIRNLSPSSIAILGAGFLNDIPLDDLIEDNRKVLLVDWIENVAKIGVSRSIICRSTLDRPSCLFCVKGTGHEYCKNYTDELLAENVCTNYEAVKTPFETCINYAPAKEPNFIKADITGGVGRSFAKKIEKALPSCKTAKAAFLKAISLTEKTQYKPIPVEDSSIDLVTSSMVISQFDIEPYTYFSTQLEKKFGRNDLIKHEAKLLPLMEELRTKLFTLQVGGHVKEMHRIVKKDNKARIYLSAELFRSFPDRKHFFLVKDMPKAMELIGHYFFYEFGDLIDGEILRKTEIGEGVSINQSYTLVAKTDA
jgi:hypothetical protein